MNGITKEYLHSTISPLKNITFIVVSHNCTPWSPNVGESTLPSLSWPCFCRSQCSRSMLCLLLSTAACTAAMASEAVWLSRLVMKKSCHGEDAWDEWGMVIQHFMGIWPSPTLKLSGYVSCGDIFWTTTSAKELPQKRHHPTLLSSICRSSN